MVPAAALLPPEPAARRLKMIEDLEAYHATSLVWAALGGGSISLPYLEEEAWGEVDQRFRFYGFLNDAEFIAACQERGIKVFGCVFEVQGWEFPVELNDDETEVLSMNEPRGSASTAWLGLREFTQNTYPKIWKPLEDYFPTGSSTATGRRSPTSWRSAPARHLRRGVPLDLGRGPRQRALRLPDGPQQPGLARVPQGDHPDPDRRGRRGRPPRRGRPADLRDRLRRLLLQGLHEAVPGVPAGAGAEDFPRT